MKIAAYSAGSIERASSRLRSFYLFSLAKEFGLDVSRPSKYSEALCFDVVHIQKLLDFKLLFWVAIYRIFGLQVIYDIDDQPTGLKSFLGYLLVLFLSSVITVDSESRKLYWNKYLYFKKIEVINDIADSADVDLKLRKRTNLVDSYGFFWTGYACNLQSLNGFVNSLSDSLKCKLTVSIERESIEYFQDRYPMIKFIPWFLDVAYDDIIDAKFMILNHNFDQDSLLKSENKMVLAILAGFIPIVSRTPSYEKLAKSLDADFLLFDGIEDVVRIATGLRQIDSHVFLTNALDFINMNYSRSAVLKTFNRRVLCQ